MKVLTRSIVFCTTIVAELQDAPHPFDETIDGDVENIANAIGGESAYGFINEQTLPRYQAKPHQAYQSLGGQADATRPQFTNTERAQAASLFTPIFDPVSMQPSTQTFQETADDPQPPIIWPKQNRQISASQMATRYFRGLGNSLEPRQLAQDGNTSDRIAVIGAGFAGLAAALELKRLGGKRRQVVVFEKHAWAGGRANQFVEEGFTFDAGPSWYWFPELYENIFQQFGKSASDYYQLQRLQPAYRMIFPDGLTDRNETITQFVDVPGSASSFKHFVTQHEPESETSFHDFWADAEIKYNLFMHNIANAKFDSFFDLFDLSILRALISSHLFGNLSNSVTSAINSEHIRTVLSWPTGILGARPEELASAYSFVTYGGHNEGTFYPFSNDGTTFGMTAVAKALKELGEEIGVEYRFGSEIESFLHDDYGNIRSLRVKGIAGAERFDGVVGTGDYHHLEQRILDEQYRRYDETYWSQQIMSPSVLVYFVGVDTVLPLPHHTIFFDADLQAHLSQVYGSDGANSSEKSNVDDMTESAASFYVTATSFTNPRTAPPHSTNLVILVPVSSRANGTDTEGVRGRIFDIVLRRLSAHVMFDIRAHVLVAKHLGPADFENSFGAFRGNAFGHANVLSQSLIFKPKMKSLVPNLYFAGHMAHPGPGVASAMLSGQVAARALHTEYLSPAPDSVLTWLWRTIFFFTTFMALRGASQFTTPLSRSVLYCTRLMREGDHSNIARNFLLTAALVCIDHLCGRDKALIKSASMGRGIGGAKDARRNLEAILAIIRVTDAHVQVVMCSSAPYTARVAHREQVRNLHTSFCACINQCAYQTRRGDHIVLPALLHCCRRLGDEFIEKVKNFLEERLDFVDRVPLSTGMISAPLPLVCTEKYKDLLCYADARVDLVTAWLKPLLGPSLQGKPSPADGNESVTSPLLVRPGEGDARKLSMNQELQQKIDQEKFWSSLQDLGRATVLISLVRDLPADLLDSGCPPSRLAPLLVETHGKQILDRTSVIECLLMFAAPLFQRSQACIDLLPDNSSVGASAARGFFLVVRKLFGDELRCALLKRRDQWPWTETASQLVNARHEDLDLLTVVSWLHRALPSSCQFAFIYQFIRGYTGRWWSAFSLPFLVLVASAVICEFFQHRNCPYDKFLYYFSVPLASLAAICAHQSIHAAPLAGVRFRTYFMSLLVNCIFACCAFVPFEMYLIHSGVKIYRLPAMVDSSLNDALNGLTKATTILAPSGRA